jgi:glycosyltransferase involved in cell wall biosynthesis
MLRFTRAGKTPLPIFWVKMAAYRFLFWYSNKKSKAIITISNYVKEDLAKNYPFTKDKTTTTYCASEPPLSGASTQPAFISKNDPFLLYVGTAFPHKNLASLVKIMPELLEKHPDLKLVLAGKKEQYYAKLEKLIDKRNLSDNIITPGFVSDNELKWLYSHCQAYVFPSLSEGFGLPGLEAMAHNAPVVSSNATCLPEIYGNAALFFNPENQEDILLKIERVLTDTQLRKELIVKGHAQLKKFSWKKMASETLDVYMKVTTQ